MPLNFPSSSLTLGQLYEGWVWNGSAWDFVGRSVGITTTASPTTTTTTAAVSIPVVTLTGITQSNENNLATLEGTIDSGSGITETGFAITETDSVPNNYPVDHYDSGTTSSPFTYVSNVNWATLQYYRAYAINDDGIGYSDPYPWSHLQYFMPNLTRTGANINCEFTFAAGVGAALNSEIDEIGFIWSYESESLPTWDTKEDYVLANVQQIPVVAPFKVTGTINNGVATYVRAYIRFNGGFYWYSLDAKLVAAVTTTTTSTTSTTTTTTLPQPWIGSINSASNYSSPVTNLTLSVGYSGGSNITEAGIKRNTTSSPVGATDFVSGTTGSPYSTTITGLSPTAELYLWSYAVVNGTEVISEEDGPSKWYFWYQNAAIEPVVNTSGIGNPIVTTTSLPVGSMSVEPYEVGIVWSKTINNPTLANGTKVVGTRSQSSFGATILGGSVTAGTYYIRPFCTHANQTSSADGLVWYGSTRTITI